jgi:hypothetical protein
MFITQQTIHWWQKKYILKLRVYNLQVLVILHLCFKQDPHYDKADRSHILSVMFSNFGSIGPFAQWFLAVRCHGSEASLAEDTVAEGITCTCWALLLLYTWPGLKGSRRGCDVAW